MATGEKEKQISSAKRKSSEHRERVPLEDISMETNENDDIVTTLYAKPGVGAPLLNLSKLQKGVYEETTFLSLRTYLLFTDIGKAAMKAASMINRDTEIELIKSSLLEEDKSWQVLIKNPDIKVLINSIRFKPMGKFTSAFYMSLDISSKPAPLLAFVRELTENLKRKPWETEGGELDWNRFMKKTSWARNEVIKQWNILTGSTETSEDEIEEDEDLICQKCKKSVDKEYWIVCPYCGESLDNPK